MLEWRVNAAGERQWLGADGNWYSSRELASTTGVRLSNPAPSRSSGPAPPPVYRRSTPDRRARRRLAIFVALLLAAIAAIVVHTFAGPKATYDASITGEAVLSPSRITVLVRVVNVGSAAGKPQCTVTATAPTGAHGVNAFTATQTLRPGTVAVYHLQVTITTTAAAGVSRATAKATC